MAEHNDTGKWGERIAREELTSKGYGLVEWNWKSGRYELDIIAMKDDRLVFVEVKTRATADYDPYHAIDRKKMARLIAAAQVFMYERKFHHDMQLMSSSSSERPRTTPLNIYPTLLCPR